MSNKRMLFLIILVALGLVAAGSAAVGNTIYMPVVMRQPTVTPTFTSTPTNTPVGTPTKTPTITPTSTPKPGVYIQDIDPSSGSDINNEFVSVKNTSSKSVDMTGWFIREAKQNFRFNFPDDFTLSAGSTVKIWTKSGTNNASNLFWGRTDPAWNNNHDCAYLKDKDGNPVDSFCY